MDSNVHVDCRCVCALCIISLELDCLGVSSGVFFVQAEDGIRDLVRSRGLGDVYKRQELVHPEVAAAVGLAARIVGLDIAGIDFDDGSPLILSLIHI